ncbi:MAG TPA: type II toxin-antitoxin system VapC family toxin [Rhodanobacteraceae bacterium]
MATADSNLIVRLLTEDDAARVATLRALIDRLAAQGDTLFIPLTVVLEIEWVLRSRYVFDKNTVLSKFEEMLETGELEFQDEPVVEQALALFREYSADFGECLHLGTALQHLRPPLLTFDQGAARLPGAELLT